MYALGYTMDVKLVDVILMAVTTQEMWSAGNMSGTWFGGRAREGEVAWWHHVFQTNW